MQKYNVSKPEKYIGKDGVEKTFWANVGTMTEFNKPDGSISRILEIPAIGLKANIFPIVEKQEVQQVEPIQQQEEVIAEREPCIDPVTGLDCNDIPF